jgi:hypothetical protein
MKVGFEKNMVEGFRMNYFISRNVTIKIPVHSGNFWAICDTPGVRMTTD